MVKLGWALEASDLKQRVCMEAEPVTRARSRTP